MEGERIYDVVLVGYGPVSQVMALMLARKGWSVAVVERWHERYPLPRAVCVDHEMYRMLNVIGLGGELSEVTHPAPVYRWFNADWRELLSIDWSLESISGGSEVNFVHQPTLEQMFDRAVKAQPSIEVHLGWDAVAVTQADDSAAVKVQGGRDGSRRVLRGRYLIGADGANSIVRGAIGSEWQDKGFEADWLVLDILPHEGAELDIPPAAQWCNPERPTTIVPAGIRDGRFFRRWEFMRLPHESIADIENEETAWRLLAPWVRPDQATLVRHKVYTFRSLIAGRWRDRRVLLAGDAAHVMPPFMGQGMCAGFRDDWNLAWKLDLVLRGDADDRLLDTYQVERLPHVSTIIDMSMYLGKVICIPDAAEAERRDEAFLNGTAPPPPDFPYLTSGLIDRDADGSPRGPAGRLGPHGHVARHGGVMGRFDAVVGSGFVVVSREPIRDRLTAAQRDLLARIDAHVAVFDGGQDVEALADVDAKYLPFMERHGLVAMVVRPDFYLYGGASDMGEAAGLIDRLGHDLAAHGWRVRTSEELPALSLAG